MVLNEAKSALHDLGKLSKFAKLGLASPDELPVEGKVRMSKDVTVEEKILKSNVPSKFCCNGATTK